MYHTEDSLLKLSKNELTRLALVYQGKFNYVLQSLKDDVSEMKPKFNVLEFDLQVSKNVTDNLTQYIKILDRKYHGNEQYSRRGNASKYQAFLAILKIALLKTLFGGSFGKLSY